MKTRYCDFYFSSKLNSMVVQSLENLEKSGNKIWVRENLEKPGNFAERNKNNLEMILCY